MSKGEMIAEKMVKAKVVIPTKSRIAAWWMLIVGGIAGAIGLAILFVGLWTGGIQDEFGFIFYIFGLGGVAIFIFSFLPGLLVLRGGRRGWIFASVILFILAAASSTLYPLIPLIFFFIPLTLILLDHISYKLVALFLILIVIIYFVIPIIVNI